MPNRSSSAVAAYQCSASANSLSRTSIGADALDQSVVRVGLTRLGSLIASEKHPASLVPAWSGGQGKSKRVGFHYIAKNGFRLSKTRDIWGATCEKSLELF